MSIGSILYTILIYPLQLFFEVIYVMAYKMIGNPGLAIIALSLTMNFFVLPIYRRADAMQAEEAAVEKRMAAGLAHIKKTFKGDERMMMQQTYYRQNNYKPTDVFKGAVSLFLEIPFFIAAYRFLSGLELLHGVSFWMIQDLGQPDGLLQIAGHTVNLLPIIMTAVNLVSCVIFTRDAPRKTKIQLYAMALFFLVFLYTSPSGLVFYWTLNNIFSLVKTVFYKLKHAREIVYGLFATGGVALIVLAIGIRPDHPRKFLVLVALGLVFILPIALWALRRRIRFTPKGDVPEPNGKIFFGGALFLALLIGGMIPSGVLTASPLEFLNTYDYLNPIWFLVSSLCIAFGGFVIWGGVFYGLAGKSAKIAFEAGVWALCGAALADYMLFGRDMGTLTNTLSYNGGVAFTRNTMLLNLAVLAVVVGVFLLLYALRTVRKRLISQVLLVAAIALGVITVVNAHSVQTTVSAVVLRDQGEARISLSAEGQNVVVIMLDRGLGELVPYLMEEKPELKEKFAGFTWYANVVSHGAFTNVGTPGLYGGYEYTPIMMNSRSDELLGEKQNEALKVMPVLFDENGFDVTVFNPTYAGYTWIADTSIYDDYPDIQAFNVNGMFNDGVDVNQVKGQNMRNFFCYALMKASPALIQNLLYDEGSYNSADAQEVEETTQINTAAEGEQVKKPLRLGTQEIIDNHTAKGVVSSFYDTFMVLQNLSNITRVNDNAVGSFLMMSNDSTHEPNLLQLPGYTMENLVDNTAYEASHGKDIRTDGAGNEIELKYRYSTASYHVNMASFIQLGAWFDYLREVGLYDNTRIILVSDHGRMNFEGEERYIGGVEDDLYDVNFYYPLLMVKDYNATEFTTSEEFMTNADVPTLAFEGLIEDPVNPFTGNLITDSEKTAHPQYVLGSWNYDVKTNNGTQFLPGLWMTVEEDARDLDNWTIIDSGIVLTVEDVNLNSGN